MLLYDLQLKADNGFARHVLANAMLHVRGWWEPAYSRSPMEEFFEPPRFRFIAAPVEQPDGSWRFEVDVDGRGRGYFTEVQPGPGEPKGSILRRAEEEMREFLRESICNRRVRFQDEKRRADQKRYMPRATFTERAS